MTLYRIGQTQSTFLTLNRTLYNVHGSVNCPSHSRGWGRSSGVLRCLLNHSTGTVRASPRYYPFMLAKLIILYYGILIHCTLYCIFPNQPLVTCRLGGLYPIGRDACVTPTLVTRRIIPSIANARNLYSLYNLLIL